MNLVLNINLNSDDIRAILDMVNRDRESKDRITTEQFRNNPNLQDLFVYSMEVNPDDERDLDMGFTIRLPKNK